jgi:hypothetical protein
LNSWPIEVIRASKLIWESTFVFFLLREGFVQFLDQFVSVFYESAFFDEGRVFFKDYGFAFCAICKLMQIKSLLGK